MQEELFDINQKKFEKITKSIESNIQKDNYNDIISSKDKDSKFDRFVLDENDSD